MAKSILLLSDTHSYIDNKILDWAKKADEVWHAGDIGDQRVTDAIKAIKPLRAVYGNIDGHELRSEFPLNQRFKLEGVDVWITHIGGYPNRYSREVKEEIKRHPPQLFISGHSHILKVMNDKNLGLLHMNPGAVGVHGFHQKRTMLRFNLEDGNIKNLEVIDFGKRGQKSNS
ncbi:metallophosphoesterase family protein [Psychroflexus tropicus]|uniref:metallophosphoesterase family protein n=1 Tax=Psychroflexus tropicus TaxID=197345 RepID=UPI000373C5B4|nr:metallophosphoesterase family protein [Psychroflexus tropicus]